MRAALWVFALFVAAGCWQPRYFEPREHLTGASPDGLPAAVYPVAEGGGLARHGEVRVWSDGARARDAADGEEVVDLHVGIELENNGEGALDLDVASLQVEQLFVGGQPSPPLRPASVQGEARAAPGATARLDVLFRPPTSAPRDVDSFGLRFAVRDGAAVVLAEMTPFAPARPVAFYGGPYGGWGSAYGGGALHWGWGVPVWGGAPWPGAWGYGPGPWGWSGAWAPGWGGPGCR